MRRAAKNPASCDAPAQRAKDRKLVDLLWGMEKEQQKTRVLEESETNSYCESWGRGDADVAFPSVRHLEVEDVP
eukprot:CAMPEP_0173400398 /NCGR_PEP_ID=MMETSP1356-20130122/47822_1 /TAXON_ID=77927 ORGANISM="Hemiselmis virescens, Strain PCC157" /NCGR_SAMPLE_ID=MMETSP1356 /ASSEMBLY_ACC=CAM_ASM_000847 /LENGTH=73 /DNA_ID=CAMNT_0014360319 /DNA_START=51 /DNA_END=268 /DNA_ORIENTATION=+